MIYEEYRYEERVYDYIMEASDRSEGEKIYQRRK